MRDLIIQIVKESVDLKLRFFEQNADTLLRVAEAILQAFRRGNKIMIFGNGGSAADSQHIAAEFVNRFIIERPPLPAIALTTDSSVITSISNDYDFSDIFAKQIKAIGAQGDIAMGISTSGRAFNVVKGLEEAKKMDIVTVGLTGKDGGRVKDLVDFSLHVNARSVPRIQEVHITVGHVLCELVDQKLFKTSLEGFHQ